MIKIGLTGGIGSGKSLVAKYFAKLGAPVIDADAIVHELLAPNTSTYKKILAHFGTEILTPTQELDRKKMRTIIFHNQNERIWLEKLLHPRVKVLMLRRAAKIQAPYCILVIPLLFETAAHQDVDRVLVVDCPQKLQLQRVAKRDHAKLASVKAIMANQVTRQERLGKTTDLIINNASIAKLLAQVKKLHQFYLILK